MTDRTHAIKVNGRDGFIGWVNPDEQPDQQYELLVRTARGQAIVVPADMIVVQEDGTYYLPMSKNQFEVQKGTLDDNTEQVIPVITEDYKVSKRTVESGKVRVNKQVFENEELVNVDMMREEIQVERVPINRMVESPLKVREEGDTLIIPVMEEVVVVEKRLLLKEEVRVKRVRVPWKEQKRVTLRSEEVYVEREDLHGKPSKR